MLLVNPGSVISTDRFDEGGSVTVTLIQLGRRVQLFVADTVTEIRQGDHSELFERFYRVGQFTEFRGRGHGLGLSEVEAIVKVHGGRISA